MRKLLIGLLVLLTAACVPAYAGEATFSWDASTGATGYNIYIGTQSGVYDAPADVGNVTAVAMELADGCVQYFVAATAYGVTGESGFSNEVVTYPRPVVAGDPVISGGNLVFTGNSFSPILTVQVNNVDVPFTVNTCAMFSIPVISVPTAADGVPVPFTLCNDNVCMTYMLFPVSAPGNLTAS